MYNIGKIRLCKKSRLNSIDPHLDSKWIQTSNNKINKKQDHRIYMIWKKCYLSVWLLFFILIKDACVI